MQEAQSKSRDGADVCTIMDEALCFLNSTTVVNLDILQIVINILEKRFRSQASVLRSVYENLQVMKDYDVLFKEKMQKLSQTHQASIPLDLYRRFYSRMSQKLLLKVLFFNIHRHSLGFISQSLLDVLEAHDNTEAGNNFEKFISIMSLIILESNSLIRLLLGLIVDENMVSSEEEFFRVMGKMETKDKIGSTIGITTLNKLSTAARKYNNSNRMNDLLNSFFANLKDEGLNVQGQNGRLRRRFIRFRTSLAEKSQKFGTNSNQHPFSRYRYEQMRNKQTFRARESIVMEQPFALSAADPSVVSNESLDPGCPQGPASDNPSETKDKNERTEHWGMQTPLIPTFDGKTLLGEDRKSDLFSASKKASNTHSNQEKNSRTQIRKIGVSAQMKQILEGRRSKFKARLKNLDDKILDTNKEPLLERNSSSLKQKSYSSFRGRFSSNHRVPKQSYARSVSVELGKTKTVPLSQQPQQEQPQNQPQAQFTTIRKFKQYVSGISDKQFVLNWEKLGLEGKSGQVIKGPMAISKELIVGMKFQRPNKAKRVESLSNLVSQIVQLEYLSKVAKGEISEDTKLRFEMNMVKYRLHVPPKPADKEISYKRSAFATPSTTASLVGSDHRRAASSYELLDRTKNRVLRTMNYDV